jgi:hypothetical protein
MLLYSLGSKQGSAISFPSMQKINENLYRHHDFTTSFRFLPALRLVSSYSSNTINSVAVLALPAIT